MKSRSQKIKWGIALIVWPFAALFLSLIAYTAANFLAGAAGVGGAPEAVSTIINIILFVLASVSIVLGLPSIVVGIVLLSTAGSASSSPSHERQQKGKELTAHGRGLSVTGMVLGISSVVFVMFLGFILGVLAVIFSAIGLKRKAGKGLAVAGLVTGIIGTIMSIIIGIMFIATVALAGVQQSANDSTVHSNATVTRKHAELFFVENDRYPSLNEVRNHVEQAGTSIVIGAQGSESSEDVIYIPCYGDGAVIWYWSSADEEYQTIEVGSTAYCEWNE